MAEAVVEDLDLVGRGSGWSSWVELLLLGGWLGVSWWFVLLGLLFLGGWSTLLLWLTLILNIVISIFNLLLNFFIFWDRSIWFLFWIIKQLLFSLLCLLHYFIIIKPWAVLFNNFLFWRLRNEMHPTTRLVCVNNLLVILIIGLHYTCYWLIYFFYSY